MSCIIDNRIFVHGPEADLVNFSKTYYRRLSAVSEVAYSILPERHDGNRIIDVVLDDDTAVSITIPVFGHRDDEGMAPNLGRSRFFSEMAHGFESPTCFYLGALTNYRKMNGEALVLSQLYPNLDFALYYDYEQADIHIIELFRNGVCVERVELRPDRFIVPEDDLEVVQARYNIFHACLRSKPKDHLVLQILGPNNQVVWSSGWPCSWNRHRSSDPTDVQPESSMEFEEGSLKSATGV